MGLVDTSPELGKRPVKCVVWDLDGTIWDGVLLEDRDVRVRPGVVTALHELDERGILHSIASRNDVAAAEAKLRSFGIDEFFLYPEINWGSKAASISRIADRLRLGLEDFAFVDDQAFEREEVHWCFPQVQCFDADTAPSLPALPAFQPGSVTEESRQRRLMYRSEASRQKAEEEFTGSPHEFLASLSMVLTIGPATEGDLRRAEELTVRTHQLNTTGRTYSYAELDELRRSPRYLLLIAELEDRFGSYGKIGLALVEVGAEVWTIRLFLMSCRVLSRGVGAVFCDEIRRRAAAAGAKLRADFVRNDRNRMMYVTYRLMGFAEIERRGDELVLEAPATEPPPLSHMTVRVLG